MSTKRGSGVGNALGKRRWQSIDCSSSASGTMDHNEEGLISFEDPLLITHHNSSKSHTLKLDTYTLSIELKISTTKCIQAISNYWVFQVKEKISSKNLNALLRI
ncbi:hypothetical protein L1887_08049 [Cichorium endivia]|nr:hypothetical protein L1887_08049 [Cichorium endivia]